MDRLIFPCPCPNKRGGKKKKRDNIIQALTLIGEEGEVGNCKYTTGKGPVVGLPKGQKKKLIHVQLFRASFNWLRP